jgi:Mg2+ and Co2+ transporter CorA
MDYLIVKEKSYKKEKPARGFFRQHFSRRRAIPAQAISRSRARRRKNNAIRENSRRFAVLLFHASVDALQPSIFGMFISLNSFQNIILSKKLL